MCLAFCKSKNILISSSTDKTIRIWKLDENFDKIKNPLFHCISVIKDFVHKKPIEKDDNPFWINTLSIKETDVIELYAGDTRGYVHLYEYYDPNMNKNTTERDNNRMIPFATSRTNDKRVINNFSFVKSSWLHKLTIIKAVHSIFDSMIYTIGFDSQLQGYNMKDNKSMFIIYII